MRKITTFVLCIMLVTSILLSVIPIKNVKAAPTELTLGVPLSGELEGPQDINYYKVWINAGEHLFVTLDKSIQWYSQLGIKYGQLPSGSVNDGWSIDNSDSVVEITSTQQGYYYIIVCSWSNDYGSYNITAQSTNHPPNKPQKPTGPTTRVTGQSGKYFTSTTDPNGDKVQYRFDWNALGSHQYSTWTTLVNSGQTGNKTHTWNSPGTYVVKAQARDEHGVTGVWSNGLTVTVTGENHAPNKPLKPTGPTTRLVGQQGTYWANGTDPDGDQIQYRFDWNASGSHSYSSWTSLVNSGQKLSNNNSWSVVGTYVVKVQSRDEHGAASVWSNGLTVTVTVTGENHPPNQPKTPTGPTALLTGEQGTYWANGTDPDGDKIQYRFDWNASGSHTYSSWTSLVNSGTKLSKNYTWTSPGTYIVKVESRDEHGMLSVWSNELTVSVYVNHPPNQPKKPTGPTSRLVGQQGTYWANGTDPDGDHIQFRFDWNASGSHTYSAWTSLVNSGQKVSMVYSWTTAGTYVVKVQSKDEHGKTSVWSNGLTVIVHTEYVP